MYTMGLPVVGRIKTLKSTKALNQQPENDNDTVNNRHLLVSGKTSVRYYYLSNERPSNIPIASHARAITIPNIRDGSADGVCGRSREKEI